MKKICILSALYFVLFLSLSFLVVLGIDIEVARSDYLREYQNGNFEKSINGCVFDFVCDRYTKELQK